MLLISPDIYLPKQGEGATRGQGTNQRKQLENSGRSIHYLKVITDPDPHSPYRHEIGFTIEVFLTDFALHLATTDHVKYDLDDASAAHLIGNYLEASDFVLDGHWSRYYRWLSVGRSFPGYRGGDLGCPSGVRVASFV